MMESSGPSSSLLHEQYYFNNSFQEEAPANSPRRMEEHVGNNTNNIGGGRLKAHVLWHPLFAQVLASHVACLRIATPVDHLPSIDAQLPHSHKSLSIKYPPPLHTPNIINNNNNHNQDELNQFMAHYVLVLSSFKEQLQQHVRVHAMEAVMACWELERILLGLTGVSLGVGTNATMSDDEDKDPLSSYSDDDLYDMKGSNSYREGLGPLILSDIERSLMEHVRCELKEELKMGYKSRIVDVREEILRKRRVGKLPSDTTTILKAWWQVHAKWPYPTEEEKDQLVQETGLQLKQINNWFINQRKRKWHTSSSSTMKSKRKG